MLYAEQTAPLPSESDSPSKRASLLASRGSLSASDREAPGGASCTQFQKPRSGFWRQASA